MFVPSSSLVELLVLGLDSKCAGGRDDLNPSVAHLREHVDLGVFGFYWRGQRVCLHRHFSCRGLAGLEISDGGGGRL